MLKTLTNLYRGEPAPQLKTDINVAQSGDEIDFGGPGPCQVYGDEDALKNYAEGDVGLPKAIGSPENTSKALIANEVDQFFIDAEVLAQLAIDGGTNYATLKRRIGDGGIMGGKKLSLEITVMMHADF